MSGRGSPFAAVTLPHLDAAYNLARWLTDDPSAAEDVVQTAMLRALDHFATFRGDNARAWLLQIVRNAAYTWLAERRCGPLPLTDELALSHSETPDSTDDPETALTRSQARTNLARVLAVLPAELKECIVLRELEEMSYREIADVTGVPVGTVMSRLWRARRILLRKTKGGTL